MRRTIVPPTVGKRRRERCSVAVALEQPRAGDTAALVRIGVREQRCGTARLEPHVGIEDQRVRRARGRDQRVLVLRERARSFVDERPEAQRARKLGAAVGHVLAHERRHAVPRERRQTVAEEVALVVRDDGGDDAIHASTSR